MAKRRKKLNKVRSNRAFKKAAKPHPKNLQYGYRGGIRA